MKYFTLFLVIVGCCISFACAADIVERALPVAGQSVLKSIDSHVIMQATTMRVYQSALQQSVVISGAGFAADLSLDLDPPLFANVDYILNVTSSTRAVLSLLPGRKWRSEPGQLLVRGFKSGGSGYAVPHEGVNIATVLADPAVHYVAPAPLEVQYLNVKISGAGFANAHDIKLTFSPHIVRDYHIMKVEEDHTLYLEMLIDNTLVRLGDPEDVIDLRVATIDTGAGAITLNMSHQNKDAVDS